MPSFASVTQGWNQVVSTLQTCIGRSAKGSGGQQLTMLDKKGEANPLAWAETVKPTAAEVPALDERPMQPGLPPGVFAPPAIREPKDGEAEGGVTDENAIGMNESPASGATGETASEQPDSHAAAAVLSEIDDAEELGNPVAVTKVMGTRPRIKTMVEAIPQGTSAPGSSSDLLPDYLQDVFQKKVIVDPRVQAFLAQHGTVDIHQLVDDLAGFAEEIGAR